MSYRVKLPQEGKDETIGRLSYPVISGDSGDSGDRARKKIYSEPLGTPAPILCPPLPKGVLIVRYAPKEPPVAIAPISIVTDVNKFIRFNLEELDARLHHPIQIRAGGSVCEILAKLAEVGVELEICTHQPFS